VSAPSTFAWLDGGTIVFARVGRNGRPALWKVSDAGGVASQLTTVGLDEQSHRAPARLPGGKAVVFAIQTGAGATASSELATVRIADGVVTRLGIKGTNSIYADGFLFYIRPDLGFGAVPFDPRRARATGEPFIVPNTGTVETTGFGLVSENGTMVAYPNASLHELVSVDRRGTARPLLGLQQAYVYPRLSPDGKRILVGIGTSGLQRELWVVDLSSGTPTKLSSERGNLPDGWTPDGRRVMWTHGADAPGVWSQPWDGSTPPEQLLAGAQGAQLFPGGTEMITSIVRLGAARETRIVPIPVDTTRWSSQLTLRRTPGFPMPRPSPDGKWIAYVDQQSGVSEVFVNARSGGRYQISLGGGLEPVWSKDGKELFYRAPQFALMSARLELGTEARVVSRDTLFPIGFAPGNVAANYDVTGDGHFIIPRPIAVSVWPIVTIGWTDELRERLRQGASPR
jgi:serine/threonine-protein kinase